MSLALFAIIGATIAIVGILAFLKGAKDESI